MLLDISFKSSCRRCKSHVWQAYLGMSHGGLFGFWLIISPNICYFLHSFPLFVLLIPHLFLFKSKGSEPRKKFWQFLQLIQELSHPSYLGTYLGLLTIKIYPGPFLCWPTKYSSLPPSDTKHFSGHIASLQSTSAHNYLELYSDIQQNLKQSAWINLKFISLINLWARRSRHHLLMASLTHLLVTMKWGSTI